MRANTPVLLKDLNPGNTFVKCFNGGPGMQIYKLLAFDTSDCQCLVEFRTTKICMSKSEIVYKLWD